MKHIIYIMGASLFLALLSTSSLTLAATYDNDGDGYFTNLQDSARERGEDCNDRDATVFPGQTENCSDGLDNDCNGGTDSRDANCMSRGVDADGDGYYTNGDGITLVGEDCDDTANGIYPGGDEGACSDGIDNDCDRLMDSADPDCTRVDADSDGFTTDSDSDHYEVNEDCDDTNSDVLPRDTETSCEDGVDNNCDWKIDLDDEDCAAQQNTTEGTIIDSGEETTTLPDDTTSTDGGTETSETEISEAVVQDNSMTMNTGFQSSAMTNVYAGTATTHTGTTTAGTRAVIQMADLTTLFADEDSYTTATTGYKKGDFSKVIYGTGQAYNAAKGNVFDKWGNIKIAFINSVKSYSGVKNISADNIKEILDIINNSYQNTTLTITVTTASATGSFAPFANMQHRVRRDGSQVTVNQSINEKYLVSTNLFYNASADGASVEADQVDSQDFSWLDIIPEDLLDVLWPATDQDDQTTLEMVNLVAFFSEAMQTILHVGTLGQDIFQLVDNVASGQIQSGDFDSNLNALLEAHMSEITAASGGFITHVVASEGAGQ